MNIAHSLRVSNRGGSYVDDIRILPHDDCNGHDLEFHGHAGAVTQVLLCDRRYQPVGRVAPLGTQVVRGDGRRPTPETRMLLDVLERVLTVPTGPNLDFALTLDWYKIPADQVAAKDWANTALGQLHWLGKYEYKAPADLSKRRDCGVALADRLVEAIEHHPVLRRFHAIAALPGHDPRLVGFGAQLSQETANKLRWQFVRCVGNGFRAEAKSMDRAQLAETINNTFSCPVDLSGQDILVVDDMYGSGTTMAEAARALKEAGAQLVAGICPVRTLRSG